MSSPYNKTPVSRLQEYVVSKDMSVIYELTYDGVGTHNPRFTIRVQVGDLWEEGTDSSKKRAKHQAAQKMLRALNIWDFKEMEEYSSCIEKTYTSEQEVLEKFTALRSGGSSSVKNATLLYKDNHNAYIILQEMSLTLLNLVNKNETVDEEDALKVMEKISDEVGAELSTEEIPSKEEGVGFIIMTLSVNPPAAGIGHDKSSAAFSLLKSLLFLSK